MKGTHTISSPRGVGRVAFAAFLLLCFLTAEGSAAGAAVSPGTRNNRSTIAAIDLELRAHKGDARYCAVLRGLRWCIILNADPSRFENTFSNYITMLDELSLSPSPPALRKIVHTLIRREFVRALPGFGKMFTADSAGYMNFVSVLPVAYRHHVPAGGLKRFAAGHFAGVEVPDRLEEFRQAARKLQYLTLTGIIVEAAFVDMAYELGVARDFRLPLNRFTTIMDECAAIPFVHRHGDAGYYDQNYYATHVVLALNHFGGRRLRASAAGDHVFAYLSENYPVIRNKAEDLDLLCEYLYCLRQFGMSGPLVSEAEQYVLSRQHPDGSWGSRDDIDGRPYDHLHPTWTAITLLVLGTAR